MDKRLEVGASMRHFALMDSLSERHLARVWWEGRLPESGPNWSWPHRPDMSQIDAQNTSLDDREHQGALLLERLSRQYADAGVPVPAVLEKLGAPAARTVTTGHQLCIAGGPAFTFYKIQTAITLARHLESRWGTPVVPVFWLASEDHDFEEVSALWSGQSWQTWHPAGPIGGAVGRISTAGLSEVLHGWAETADVAEETLNGLTADADGNLSQAMRRWVHRMFGPDQLVVLDGDDAAFKTVFSNIMQREVSENLVHTAVSNCNAALADAGFTPQVHVRACNLFHLDEGQRRRIEADGKGGWHAENGAQWPSTEALCTDVAAQPEKFSPNALLRPVYQSVLLPDVAMVGGLAEIAYGMQLPDVYHRLGVRQPVLVPRDGAVVLPKRQVKLMEKAGLRDEMVLQPLREWTKALVSQAELPDSSAWRKSIMTHAEASQAEMGQLDRSLEGSVQAAAAKMENLLDRLDQQVVRAFKRKEEESVTRLEKVDHWVRPEGKPQERVCNIFQLAGAWDVQSAGAAAPLEEILRDAFEQGHKSLDWCPLLHVIRAVGP